MSKFYRYSEQSKKEQECTREDWVNSGFEIMAGKKIGEVEYVEDKKRQKEGLDKILHFSDGTTMTIEEKFTHYELGTIAMETWSNCERSTLGWAFKDISAEWIAFINTESKIFDLVRTPHFNQAVDLNMPEWEVQALAVMEKYQKEKLTMEEKRAEDFYILDWANKDEYAEYTTRSVCVSRHIFRGAVPHISLQFVTEEEYAILLSEATE